MSVPMEPLTSPPEWLIGPIASLFSLLLLSYVICHLLRFAIGEGKVNTWFDCARAYFPLTSMQAKQQMPQSAAMDSTSEGDGRKRKAKRRRKQKPRWAMFLLGASDDEADDAEVEASPFDLDDASWRSTSPLPEIVSPDQHFIGEDATPIANGGVYELEDNLWRAPVTA
eukprot:TRINITY_DN69342_c0_g1_i1.p2 TRINITY_DN69342_c0_g1~~TRINITY_DN69342_c0_g1_i1.p2  ORF type:complete len:169 (+),score=23.31 TRINITY_DN69342_c0_g1_i1:66-572(+)